MTTLPSDGIAVVKSQRVAELWKTSKGETAQNAVFDVSGRC
jgi:hypothetical protein